MECGVYVSYTMHFSSNCLAANKRVSLASTHFSVAAVNQEVKMKNLRLKRVRTATDIHLGKQVAFSDYT